MAKLRFGSGSACPAMYPEQEGVNKKYQLLERIKDDNNNEIGTVSSFFTDANNIEYAVVCLDAQYRKSAGQYCSSQTAITDMPSYSSGYSNWWYDNAKETGTINTQFILDYCTANGYTSSACTHCRSKSFTIDNVTYYGQLPNMREVFDIWANRVQIESKDTSASSQSALNFSTNRSLLSSTQNSTTSCWYFPGANSQIISSGKSNYCFVCPVLELPNVISVQESTPIVNNINLTVTLDKDSYSQNQFGSFTINGNTYTQVDFTNNIMTIQIPASTSLPWTASIAYNDGETVMSPSSGTINSSTDTNLTIRIWNMSPSSADPGIDPGGDVDF